MKNGRRPRATTLAYEDTGATFRSGTFATKPLDLAIRIHLVVLEDGHLHLLTLVLDLFGSLSRNVRKFRLQGKFRDR